MANGRYRLVFFGTSEVCIPFLSSLKNIFDISLIITQPDARGGRKKKLIEPPVKKFAASENIDFIQPEKLDLKIREKLIDLAPKIGVVISYGKFIPERIFNIPEFKTVNVHFSILPSYRGSAPVQRAIENGDNMTGITVFEIDKKMDTGPVWWQKKIKIHPLERSDELLGRISEIGAKLLPDVINNIITGKIKKTAQNEEKASYARVIKKEEGRIDWNLKADKIFNKFRAFQPWPGLFFNTGGKKFTVLECSSAKLKHDNVPGTVFALDREKMVICCGGDSALYITELQPAGKKPMTPFTYSLGNDIPPVLN